MLSSRIATIFTTVAATLLAGTAQAQTTPTAGAPAQGAQAKPAEPDALTIVDSMFALAGNRKGARASGAKGICAKGSFTPSAEARGLSKAPQFAKTVPMTVRFSMGGGNPNISDKIKTTRGFAMEFEDASDPMVFYFISAPLFFAKTPQQMFDFVAVRLPQADGKPADPEKIRAFSAANPETTKQAAWINARPVPASFAGTDYWAVQAYTLTNATGKATIAKLKAVPAAGQLGLSDDDLKAKPDNFYADELKERLGKGPVTFDFLAILGEAGDPTNDSTAMWPEENRKTVKLGTISIAALQANSVCDEKNTDPVTNLPAGIAGPANDPMFEIRATGYAASRTRRAQQ